jgi:hypothetical protein
MRRATAKALVLVMLTASVGVVWPSLVTAERGAVPSAVREAQRFSAEGDALVKAGREQEAARVYLAAHRLLQDVLLQAFGLGLREELGGPAIDPDSLMHTWHVASDLRNVNLSKLWIVLDPEDRAFEMGLEAERATLLQQFEQFATSGSAGPLEAFLLRLYPEDREGERQMEALRGGRLPASKRWARLQSSSR